MDRILELVLRRIVKTGTLQIITQSGRRLEFGDGTGTLVVARFVDAAAQRAFLLDPDLKFGELYMEERLVVEQGTLYDLIYVLVDNQSRITPPALYRWLDWVRLKTRRLQQRNFPQRSRRNAAHHYDIGNDFYRLWLDSDMQYTCAYFENDEITLEEAQMAKKRNFCAKLDVRPGHRVADLGCGWGGLALYMAQICQAGQVHGVTLAAEQVSLATERAEAVGLGDRVTFSLTDYRAVSEKFDRVASVGMFEHLGIAYYDTFFRKCSELITEDGLIAVHTMGCSDVPGFVVPWLNKYIFPGGNVPSLSEIIPCIERAGLIVGDVEVLELHYATTLRHWRARFQAHRDEVAAMYDQRFCRMWEFYLAAAEVAFRCERMVIFQFLLARKPSALPRARAVFVDRAKALEKLEEQAYRAKEPILRKAAS